MAITLLTALKSSRAEENNTALGAGALIRLYSGAAPTTVNDAPTGTLLAECTCNATGFGTVTNGTLNADDVAGETYVARDDSANGDGNIGYARLANSGGTEQIQVSTVGLPGSGQEIIVPTLTVVSTQPFEVESIALVEGG